MNKEYTKCGEVTFTSDKISITDPCYDTDIWCRIDNLKIVPGTYECRMRIKEVKLWGKRVERAMIMLKDDEETKQKLGNTYTSRSYRYVGGIGVDAGLAGFFQNKPNFTDEEYQKYVINAMYGGNGTSSSEWKYSVIYNQPEKDACGFFTSTGYGDGFYPVYAIRNAKHKITALEIRFI